MSIIRSINSTLSEEMLDWLSQQTNLVLARAEHEWVLTIKGTQIRHVDLTSLLVNAEKLLEIIPF